MVSTQSKASTSSQAVGKKPVIIKPRNVIRADLLDNINNAQGFLPSLADTLHTTGILASLHMTCYDHQTSKGASLYMCCHKDCSENLGVLPTCGSHIHWIHLGVCLMCPYCPNKRFYNSGGKYTSYYTCLLITCHIYLCISGKMICDYQYIGVFVIFTTNF